MTRRDRALGRGLWPAPADHPHRCIGRALMLLATAIAALALGGLLAVAVIAHMIEHGRIG